MTQKILLDTNFLVASFQFSFDLFEELDRLYPLHELYTLDDAVEEAKSIEGGKYGPLAEKLIEKKDIEVLETHGDGEVDDLIVDVSDEFAVATNDKELKQRLLDRGREVVIIRSGTHLEVLNRSSVGF
ncbi:PIN domain-containing protein [Candidatus Nanohalovita haloferacivicina]|uniref:type II toxin-antitoxin system VapC family toxin n=1 Tax=Candidatus Nanohalovita haloferacivicina TaxID=2978046 RepID=UPI00325FB064|nr:Putative RNA-binding protein containing PIN domain [Candidatus Nanohalobia archaeon BNXNv]